MDDELPNRYADGGALRLVKWSSRSVGKLVTKFKEPL
jgi:hypothetical protein